MPSPIHQYDPSRCCKQWSCYYFCPNTCCSNSEIWEAFNTLRPRQNGRHFPDDTFKRIFLNENVRIFIKISLKFVPKGPINKIPALVQIMVWRRPGNKPLSEPMMVRLLTHICLTRPQWVKSLMLNHFPNKFHKISMPWKLYLKLSNHSEIWKKLQKQYLCFNWNSYSKFSNIAYSFLNRSHELMFTKQQSILLLYLVIYGSGMWLAL